MKFSHSCLLAALLVATIATARGEIWKVGSPDHRQTYAYGSERHRQRLLLGKHLGIYMEFTNDPYVGWTETRQFDDFVFGSPTSGSERTAARYIIERPPAVMLRWRRVIRDF